MLALVLLLAAVGLVLYIIETSIPMSRQIRVLIRAVILICTIVYLLELFGVADLPVPRIR